MVVSFSSIKKILLFLDFGIFIIKEGVWEVLVVIFEEFLFSVG